ncbi:branched-chain amino acid ABC transporter permease [Alloalcanivorax xenomutans]|jgi:branched-chain amino acid transport system permease protein|uniref:Branched-chain amino acid ABC transporter permease n=1 Tax=Alloalcanivorax xenomutans TaxID=1094342 RepID=A0A9Q3W7H0_9GAMM|nr:branched-chain amino acid ABC transporter permease [Alloalcanivorax xenomutans]KYZ84293.1 ABC transporter permease [Alcanivorax sp. KX64203]MBA4720457.1 branched-chain amino acid ABC transporter permease [Alcanivorax sp.]ARB46838.1 ABC transporter permease [Alloalcanivorax xenomutans]MCE7509737.1 branched-chain amino acid ABC transporter permease [Alloalcanivorax xenomutans]PHS68858.1 MAG: branched-chain amino acid ABC transporter permease [Alcanivorax sp.]|tara:strand:- start:1200 stop:2141 length:942 start_codon:yes stop_codon:yes gene_type:complete
MEFLIVSTLNGVIYGMLLFMVSAGLTLIFGMMGVLNFAHASFYMLGAYFAYTLSGLFNFWVGLIVAPLLVAIIGMFIERYMLRRVHAHGHAHELLLTFGLVFIFEELIKLFYGDFPVNYQRPDYLNFAIFNLFGTDYPFYRVFIGLVALLMFIVLFVLLTRTRVGMVVRAAERLPDTARALGHNVPMVFLGVFGAGAALAGLSGAVAGAFFPTNPNMALELGVIVFVVVVVGGLGSLAGSLIASLLIGVFSSFAVGLDWSLASLFSLIGLGDWANSLGGLVTMPLSSISATVPFLLMLIVLLVRPAGLMGSKN